MDGCHNEVTLALIEAAKVLVPAILAAIAVYFPALAKGKRTPRREEIALQARHAEVVAELDAVKRATPPPEATP